MVSELIDKYLWLIRIFSGAGERGLSLPEVTQRWERQFGTPYSRRTFNNHREAVASTFGIDIECNRSTRRYFIRYGDEAVDGDASKNWLIDTFTVDSLLALGKERLSGRVAVENIPSGAKYLTPILQAMDEGRELEIRYLRYGAETEDIRRIEPYAVKESEKRWYVVGFRPDERRFRTYALDRIRSLRETGGAFRVPQNFDVEALFAHSFGIYLPDEGEEPQIILLHATEREARYLRDLPLHASQEELPGGRFRYYLIPNDNFYMELCKRGDRIEVLSPPSVRSRVKEELQRASAIYENETTDIQ